MAKQHWYTSTALREGFVHSLQNRQFLLLAFLSVIASELASYLVRASKNSFSHLFEEVIHSKSVSPTDFLKMLRFEQVFFFYLFAILLFLFSFASIIGLNGIIKDLLVEHKKKLIDSYDYAHKFIWRGIKYKLLVYAIAAFVVALPTLGILFMAISGQTDSLLFYLMVVIVIITLFVSMIYSSYGMKYIILYNEKNLKKTLVFVHNLFRKNVPDTVLFFIITASVSSAVSLLPFVIIHFEKNQLRLFFLVYFLAVIYLTSFFKISSFVFFLHQLTNNQLVKGKA